MQAMLRAPFAIVLLLGCAVGQNAGVPPKVPDRTFPEFVNGDGRQKLSQFRGQPVVVVTFADVWGGLAAAERAIKLHERFAKDGLVVIMTRVEAGGTFGDGSANVDLGAWAMKRFPGADVRICDKTKPFRSWVGLGMPPYYLVIGADGRFVEAGSMPKSPKGLKAGVERAMKAHKANRTAPDRDSQLAEHQRAIDWLLEDGQWLQAKTRTAALKKLAADSSKWNEVAAEYEAMFTAADGKRELTFDKQLQRLLKPFAKKGPGKGADKKLRGFVEKAAGTKVGARAARFAERVSQAAAIR